MIKQKKNHAFYYKKNFHWKRVKGSLLF